MNPLGQCQQLFLRTHLLRGRRRRDVWSGADAKSPQDTMLPARRNCKEAQAIRIDLSCLLSTHERQYPDTDPNTTSQRDGGRTAMVWFDRPSLKGVGFGVLVVNLELFIVELIEQLRRLLKLERIILQENTLPIPFSVLGNGGRIVACSWQQQSCYDNDCSGDNSEPSHP